MSQAKLFWALLESSKPKTVAVSNQIEFFFKKKIFWFKWHSEREPDSTVLVGKGVCQWGAAGASPFLRITQAGHLGTLSQTPKPLLIGDGFLHTLNLTIAVSFARTESLHLEA